MARAAVRAKQAQQAQAQAATKPSRKQRKHASGGNPNQDLFFSRLRRKQKWVFFGLAFVFMISFVLLGVGSGNGNGLQQMYNGIFGNGNDPVAKAQGEIKKGIATGYKDLANAYIAQSNTPLAVSSLETYLRIKKKDSAGWAQLAALKKQQADLYYQQYQQVQQASQLEAPGSLFAPTGALAGQLGSNAIDQYYSQQNNALLSPLYRNATTGYQDSLAGWQQAAKYAKPADAPGYEEQVANAAQFAGQAKVAVAAWQRYLELVPNSPNVKQIEGLCKQLGGSCSPKHKKK